MNKTKHALYAYFAHKQHTYCEWSEWKALRNVESVRDSNGWSERVINASADNFKHYSPINGCFARTRITNGRKKNCSRPEAYPFCSVIHTPNTFPFHIHTNSIQSRVIKIRQSRIFLMAKAYNVCLRVCVWCERAVRVTDFFFHIYIYFAWMKYHYLRSIIIFPFSPFGRRNKWICVIIRTPSMPCHYHIVCSVW